MLWRVQRIPRKRLAQRVHILGVSENRRAIGEQPKDAPNDRYRNDRAGRQLESPEVHSGMNNS
jgi:hypothetical protein